jgi:hypothetical protein
VREHRREASPARPCAGVALHCARGCCALTTVSPIGRSRHIPPRAVKGATALVPSPAWSPGRRGGGWDSIHAAAPVFSSRVGQAVHTAARILYIPAKVLRAPASVRSFGGTVEDVSRVSQTVLLVGCGEISGFLGVGSEVLRDDLGQSPVSDWSRITRWRKPSQAARIFPSQATRRVGGGIGGLLRCQQPSSPRNSSVKSQQSFLPSAVPLAPPFSSNGHTSEGENTPHLAVFNNCACSISQSSTRLQKKLPLFTAPPHSRSGALRKAKHLSVAPLRPPTQSRIQLINHLQQMTLNHTHRTTPPPTKENR